MFTCHFCKQSSAPGEKLKLVVTRTRIVMTPEGRQMPQIVEERARCLKCTYLAGGIAPPVEPKVVADAAEIEALAS